MTTDGDEKGAHLDHPRLVFLLDVDNTLLNNDALKEHIAGQVEALVGQQLADGFWATYEQVRLDRDFVDYPETLSRFTRKYGDAAKPAALHEIFASLPFASFLYPGVMQVLRHLRTFGTVVILSDGDPIFQPEKIRKSGLGDAVGGNVLIYVHKEHELARVFARFPADHYVAVDDKARILAALEADCPSTFTTIFVRQGHYARDGAAYRPAPDLVIQHIGELASWSRNQFLSSSEHVPASR